MFDRQIPMIDVAVNLDIAHPDLGGGRPFVGRHIEDPQNGDRMMPLRTEGCFGPVKHVSRKRPADMDPEGIVCLGRESVADTFGSRRIGGRFQQPPTVEMAAAQCAIGRLGTVRPVTPTVRSEALGRVRLLTAAWRSAIEAARARRQSGNKLVLGHLMPTRDLMFLREGGKILPGQFSERRKRHSGAPSKPRILDVKKCPSSTICQRERPAVVISHG